MGRRAVSAVLVLAAVTAAAIVSPALGGPSLGGVAKTAKKALRTAKSAKSTAKSANSKASEALARPALTPGQITRVTGPVSPIDGPTGLGSAIAFCPAGSKVLSGGGTNTTDAGGLLVSKPDATGISWFVVGEDLGGGGGTTQAEALCAPAGTATIATSSRAAVRAEVEAIVRTLEAKRR